MKTYEFPLMILAKNRLKLNINIFRRKFISVFFFNKCVKSSSCPENLVYKKRVKVSLVEKSLKPVKFGS